ncbi:MAG TPA: type II toxin-antitoxin system RelE/ParE family toxin [Isosphaeraceae bacterium]|nr:type II toxin-antitoxin system RelE/ParE family toxin [Isosphaeraceae bacterium]
MPLADWLAALPDEARDRCLARLALLEEKGHELRRPHAENLGGDIHELRIKFHRVNYRILYFFHGRTAAVVSHGLVKERTIPPAEIRRASDRMRKFRSNPERHTFQPEG